MDRFHFRHWRPACGLQRPAHTACRTCKRACPYRFFRDRNTLSFLLPLRPSDVPCVSCRSSRKPHVYCFRRYDVRLTPRLLPPSHAVRGCFPARCGPPTTRCSSGVASTRVACAHQTYRLSNVQRTSRPHARRRKRVPLRRRSSTVTLKRSATVTSVSLRRRV